LATPKEEGNAECRSRTLAWTVFALHGIQFIAILSFKLNRLFLLLVLELVDIVGTHRIAFHSKVEFDYSYKSSATF
jgi:hypothetical protein